MNPSIPNLFIPGCAQCGTSNLHELLGQHPDIQASRVREPHFFNRPFQWIRNPIEYFQLFDSSSRYRMESSLSYLPNPDTPPVLRSLFPDARFIVAVRNPKNRAYSLFRFMRRLQVENIPRFADALRAEAERYHSRDFLLSVSANFWNFQYCRSTLYDEQLARYFALFDRSRFHVISFADLSGKPVETIQSILRFLDLDPAPALRFDYRFSNTWVPREPPDNDPLEPFDDESDEIMSSVFEGLMERTERQVGHAIDWSL